VVLGSPVAGIAADEVIDPTPVIEEIVQRFIGDPEISNLPRKFKTAVTGHPSLDVVHEINDISLVGVVHPELGPGYDLWVGGGLSVSPKLAVRLGAFVTAERAAEVWYGVVRLFRDYGYRRMRTKARLKFLLAEWGPVRFREVLETEYLDSPLPDGPAAVASGVAADHVGVHGQKDGRVYVGLAPTVGRSSGEVLAALADAAEAAGSRRIRFTPHQKLLVLDVDPARLDGLLATVEPLGLTANPSPFRRSTMACTGIEYCKLAFVDTKDTAKRTILELERRLADTELDRPISLHLNGCPNSCARIQTADIGLKGQLQKNADGTDEFAFQVHLGGGLASVERDDAGLGRTVRGLKVTHADLTDYVERVTRSYLAGRTADETFAAWAHRTDEEALR
jgi:sulfite reductase (ferredoxin)